MMFWLLVSLLTIIAVLSVGYPLFIKKRTNVDGASYDKSVYLEQLDEVERDRERGQIGAAEAELARAEIARRLIALEESDKGIKSSENFSTATIVTAICGLVLVPVLSIVFYTAIGNPQRPDMPLQARMSADPKTQSIEELVARAEARAQQNPDEVQGWKVLAPVYLRLGRVQDSVNAYRNILRLEGSTPNTEAALGEALTIEAGGMVTAEAKQRFQTALAGDRTNVKPQFFIALALGQEGKFKEAKAAWEEILSKSPKDAPWVKPAEAELQKVNSKITDGAPASGLVAGKKPSTVGNPTKEDVANAATMSGEDRMAMISGMVAQLADKLKDDPANIDGWLRIIRSYAVLGRKDEAAGALTTATKHFADDPEASKKLNDLALAMNIEANNQ